MRYLVPPGKLASSLDWKKASGSILTIDVGFDRIGMAIAVHPSHGDEPLRLEPMPLELETHSSNKRVLRDSVVKELQKIVQSYNTVGVLVSWPVQKQGRVGAPCGKVLHTLDSLLEQSTMIINPQRTFALWDDHHFAPDDDVFGRSAKYGEACRHKDKTEYYASREQYAHKCSSAVAATVWNDFCMQHWPEIYQRELLGEHNNADGEEEQSFASRASNYEHYFEDDWIESTDDNETYTNAGLL